MMKQILLLFALFCLTDVLSAQDVYTIKADSVKLTGCDSSELIIENHTQAIHGFLFNTNNGRTIFKRGAQKLNDSMYLVGADTVRLGSSWLQGGNSFGSTGILGTKDNNHLDLYTNDTARLRLTKTGNLLLGSTVDNSNKLQVNGPGSFSVLPLANNNRLHLILSTNGAYDALIGSYIHDLVMQTNNSSSGVRFQFGGNTDLSGSVVNLNISGHGSGNISIASSSNDIDLFNVQNIQTDASPIFLSSGGYSGMDGVVVERNSRDTTMTDPLFTVKESDTVVMRVLKNGKMGVGVSAPSAQFHTTGTVRFAGLTSDTTKTRVIVSDASGNLYYRDASTLAANEILKADLAGGKAVLPSLAVNGAISAQRLKLSQAGWPDYVFDSSYRLPDLTVTEQYIKKYSHLPGISSATEVQSNGLDVGDHEAAVLKKIEEMTLYIIAQEKKLKIQEQQILELQLKNRELDSLKQEMAELKKMIGK